MSVGARARRIQKKYDLSVLNASDVKFLYILVHVVMILSKLPSSLRKSQIWERIALASENEEVSVWETYLCRKDSELLQ